METMINLFSAYDKDTFLFNIHIPVCWEVPYLSGVDENYYGISSSDLYDAVGEKYGIRTDNIVLYHRNKCLPYNTESPAAIDVQLAVCLPNDEDSNYQIYHDTAKRCNIPILESVEVMDQQNRTICKIMLVRHDTTVKMIKNVVVSLVKTQAFYLLYNNEKELFNHQLIADVFFESGIFKSTIKLFVKINNQPSVIEKHVQVVNLELLSRQIQLDIVENEIYNTARLKKYIFLNYKVPIKQQKLIYRSRVIAENDGETLNYLYIEDDSNYTGSISISVMIEPFNIDVKFISNYVEISGDGCMQFSGMTMIKEIKERLGEITGISSESLVLLELPASLKLNDYTYLHKVPIHMIKGVVEMKVLRSVLIQIPGKEIFNQCIYHESETIKGIKRKLEIDSGKLIFVSKLNGKILKENKRLLDLVDKGITLTFELQQAKLCVLL